jgi:GR25 family glycosyltransferase involved in LPS biosynthesis
MKAFIIVLSKIPSSLETATEMLAPLKSYGFEVELFEGTYGDDAVLIATDEGRTLHPIDHKNEPTKVNRKVAGPGALGCFYSHYRLWQKCLELNEIIFIFEDDVKFYRPYQPVKFDEILIVALGDWLGVCGENFTIDFKHEPIIDPNADQFLGSCLPGAVGYGITPKAAKKLVDEYSKTYTAADSAIRSSIVDIKIHTHLIGRALVEKDGKVSLTKKRDWLESKIK